MLACSAAPTDSSAGSTAPSDSASSASTAPEEHLSPVVAHVNGRPLYRAFYEQSLSYIRNRLPAGQSESTVERYLRAPDDAFDRLVDDELIYQQAQTEGLVAPPDEVARELDRISEPAGGLEAFFAAMRAQGLGRLEAEEGIRKRLTIDKYIKTRLSPLAATATDEEMLNFYNKHINRFTPELWVKLYHILIRCPRDAEATVVNKSRERVNKILANIRAGESFEGMARDFSEDSSAHLGGSLGFVKKGATWPEVDAIAFSIAPGLVSDPVRTDAGFHILRVTERRGGVPDSFESVKETCRKAVLTAKQSEAIQQLTDRLRASAKIVSYIE